jgi:hypothetical protein
MPFPFLFLEPTLEVANTNYSCKKIELECRLLFWSRGIPVAIVLTIIDGEYKGAESRASQREALFRGV